MSPIPGQLVRLLLSVLFAIAGGTAGAQDTAGAAWVATWAGAPDTAAVASVATFRNQTLRLIVHTSVGGNRVRVRLSNPAGSAPLAIGAARIAVRAGGAEIAPGSDRALGFGGRGATVIAAGAEALSDPVELNVPALGDLAVSLYLPGTAQAGAARGDGLQTGYVSPPGDFTASPSLPLQRTIAHRPFLAEVDVEGSAPAIVIVGDAIAAGAGSSADGNQRWSDWLARRLQALRDVRLLAQGRPAVVNRAGAWRQPDGTLLEGKLRAALATSGVRHLILMPGVEDAGGAEQAIAGLRQLAARAHAQGVGVLGATLPPCEGASACPPAKEALRQAVNDWIRAHDAFDGVLDADLALRDPGRPARLLPAYDSGDHLHPNDLGHQALADAVPLALLGPADEPAAQPRQRGVAR